MMKKLLKSTVLGIALLAGAAAQISAASADIAANKAGTSPWGPSDEIGTLNMMTEESRLDVLSRIGSGKTYDLSVDLFVGMPTCCGAFGDPSFQMYMTHAPARGENGGLLDHSSEAISMNSHTGTHIDSLNHFGLKGEIWNGVKADEAASTRGWTKSGADKIPPIIARAVMVDVAAAKGLDVLPPSYAITVEDLKDALNRQGSEIQPGDIVLIRTGQMTLWPDPSKYNLFQQSGLSLEAAQWLAEDKQAMLLGADNFGLEHFPSANRENFAPVHTYLLAEKGMSFMEVVWLEDLAADEVYEFLFMAAPLKLKGATGSPIRPVAIPLK